MKKFKRKKIRPDNGALVFTRIGSKETKERNAEEQSSEELPTYVSVFGDSLNDFHMMKHADISYVVGSNKKLINRLKQEKIKFELLN